MEATPDVATVEERLAIAGCVAADEEAAEMVAAAPDGATLEAWIARREQGEPLAWIVGAMRFCDLTVRVDPGVYVPRHQTEDLARRAGDLLSAARAPGPAPRAVDLCTGSGAVAAHLRARVPRATVVGVDIDPTAVRCARRNGVTAVVGDLDPPLRSGAFDVVTAVTPYVPTGEMRFLPADVQRYEPRRALDGGHDGLDGLRRAVASASRLLRPGGWLVVEAGGDQSDVLGPLLDAAGFGEVGSWRDEDGDLRCITARHPEIRAGGGTGPR